MSCQKKQLTTDQPILDCVLKNFVNYFKPANDEIILITETQYWTPNSSYISITKLNKTDIENDYKYLFSNFEGITVFYHISVFYNKKTDLKNKMETAINFTNYLPKRSKEISKGFPTQKRELKTINFEYNFKEKKITKIFQIAPKDEKLKTIIIKNCGVSE